jgi:hypothetical protein
MRQQGGEFSEGDFGCVVHPGLSTAVNPQSVVTKIFKDRSDKMREDHINELIDLHFPNDFIVKPVKDIINLQGNPEIRQCRIGQDRHPVTDSEIIGHSINYQYLGKTYRDIFVEGSTKEEIKALIVLTLNVIDMNLLGFSHNDIDPKNITYKDGKAYLIDIGSFTYRPGEHLFQDVFDLLNIAYRYGVGIGETYRTRLQRFTAISIKDRHIQDIKILLLEILSPVQGTAPRLQLINRNVEQGYKAGGANAGGANAGGVRRRRNRTKKRAKVKTRSKAKKSLRSALK